MDYEVQSTYNLTLIFNDGYEDSLSYQVAYSVGDVNEAPSFQYNTYNVKVNESDVSKFKYFVQRLISVDGCLVRLEV